jgi:hypothetical protein
MNSGNNTLFGTRHFPMVSLATKSTEAVEELWAEVQRWDVIWQWSHLRSASKCRQCSLRCQLLATCPKIEFYDPSRSDGASQRKTPASMHWQMASNL